MKITRKKITEEEFIKLKEMKPFSTLRQDAKSCFDGETMVCEKTLGWVRLDTLVPKINPGKHTLSNEKYEILIPDGSYSLMTHSIFGYSDKWLELELDNGDVIKMTPNHNCVVRRDGEDIECRADEILLTDKILQIVE